MPDGTLRAAWPRCIAAVILIAFVSVAPAVTRGGANALRIIVGGAPGSSTDLLVRRVADAISVTLSRPVIVLNRPGASGMIAMEAVAHAKPDGDTIGLATMSQLIFNAYLFPDLRYDPVRDFAPITTLITTPMIITAHPRFERWHVPCSLRGGECAAIKGTFRPRVFPKVLAHSPPPSLNAEEI